VTQTHAICAGVIAYELLKKPSAGIVYAVFNRTFYLKRTGHLTGSGFNNNTVRKAPHKTTDIDPDTSETPSLCCIGLPSIEPGPLNVSTSLSCMPKLTIGSQWHSDNQVVMIDNIELNLSSASVFPLFQYRSSKPGATLIAILCRFIAANAPPGNELNHRFATKMDEQLTQSSQQLLQWLDSSDDDTNCTFPDNLLGCGIGLTPAGDDIIVGVLLAMHAWHSPQLARLITEVKLRINTTSDISAAHLLAACTGHGIQSLHSLIDALGSNHVTQANLNHQISDPARALINYGHSSGYYAMKGVLLAAKYQSSNRTSRSFHRCKSRH